MQKNRLKAAYQALTNSSQVESFAQLEEEVEREGQEEVDFFYCRSHVHKKCTIWENGTLQRQSGRPVEASAVDQPSQPDADLQTQGGTLSNTPTVAQLVIQPDSQVIQPDSQVNAPCTVATRQPQTDARTEEAAESPTKSNKADRQCPVPEIDIPKPTRRLPRRTCKRPSR